MKRCIVYIAMRRTETSVSPLIFLETCDLGQHGLQRRVVLVRETVDQTMVNHLAILAGNVLAMQTHLGIKLFASSASSGHNEASCASSNFFKSGSFPRILCGRPARRVRFLVMNSDACEDALSRCLRGVGRHELGKPVDIVDRLLVDPG